MNHQNLLTESLVLLPLCYEAYYSFFLFSVSERCHLINLLVSSTGLSLVVLEQVQLELEDSDCDIPA